MSGLTKYENLPFRKKLYFVFGVSLLLCVAIAVIVLTDYCTRILVRNNIANLDIINRQAGVDFNRRRTDTEKQLFSNITMFQIPDCIVACINDKSKRELKYRLTQIVAENTYFDYACLMTDGGYICDTIEKISTNKEEVAAFSKDALERYKEFALKNGYVWVSDTENHIYLIHSIRQLSTLNHVGYIIVRMKERAFNLIEDTGLGLGLVFYDKDKRCILVESNNTDLIEDLYHRVLTGQIEEGYQRIAGEEYYAVENTIKKNGWKVMGVTPISSINNMRFRIQITASVLAVIALFCGCLLMSCLTRKVSRQIDAISDTILDAARGEIGIQAPVYMDDDIGKIARHFNEMSLQNKKLIEDLVKAETQKNNARMEAIDYKYRFLHTQINPHFIYNSLETINAIAKVNHTPEVSRVVQLIGKYFRNITKYSDLQFIALSKEFELLECFIEIYKTIRGSNICINLKYPEELKNVEIPTMLLQPIVENSFIHGMRGGNELFVISLSARSVKDGNGELCGLLLAVSDNGVGMDEAAIERLKRGKKCTDGQEHVRDDTPGDAQEHAKSSTQDRYSMQDHTHRKEVFRNIGIPNIMERLKMLYADKAELDIVSGEHGTTITISLPAGVNGDKIHERCE